MAITFAVHQPSFAPWPGFFYKASVVDNFILLDDVQFPTGFSWINRNRIKSPKGLVWLTVPVLKKGRGKQQIKDVELLDDIRWRKKHLLTFGHSYRIAPFFSEIFPFLEDLYKAPPKRLLEFNLEIIDFIAKKLGIHDKFLLQSKLGVKGKQSELIYNIAKELDANIFIAPRPAKGHIDIEFLNKHNIEVRWLDYRAIHYPQLWGDFLKDLSSLDLLFCYGDYSKKILFDNKESKHIWKNLIK